LVDAAEEVFNTYGYYDASIVKSLKRPVSLRELSMCTFVARRRFSMRSSPISIAVFATPCPRRLAEQRRD